MANSNSRNEYLQSLNRMRSNYQSSGNVLVNPSDNSTNVGTDISSFAYMNTPVQVPKQTTKVSDESFYSKLVATGNEITGNVQRGFLDFVDGIIDAVVWGAGGVGKVFGGSDEWAKNVIEHDWQSQVILFSQQLNNAFRLDNFYDPNARENYIEGWSVLGDYQKSKEYLDQMYNNSYSQDLLGEKGQDVYQGLLQTVGNVLPSIAIGGLGLPAKVAQGVSLGTMGVSSFGSGAEQALQEGANYEQAGASGVIGAVTETVSELIPLPFLNNRIGNIGSKITNKTVKEIGKAMLEEGSEEVISELLSPLSQLPYKDISEIEGSSFGDLAMAFVGGAIGGGLGGGTEITRRNITYSKKGADTLNLGMEISETIEEAQKEFQKGDKRDNNKMLEYQKQITEGTKLFKEQLEQIKLEDEKNGTNYYEKIVEVLKDPQSVTDYFDQSIEQREAKNVETQLSNLSNGRNVSVKIVSDQEYLSNPRNIGSRAYNITKTTTDGKTSTEIVIRESKVDKFYELVAHEGIAHGVIDLNKNAKRNIIDYVNSDKTFKKEFEEDLEKAKKLYKGESNEVIESEALARFLERYVKNSSSLSKITDSKAKKGIKKVLNNLKDYLSRNKLDKQANKLIKQINKAIDNIDKESVAFEPKLSYSKDTNKGENGYDFRKLQEESRRIFNQRGWKERVESFNGNLLERFSRIFRQEIHSWSSRNSNDNGLLTNTGDFKIYKNVDGTLFHDIFEISRAYLKNGELVDLHDNYNDSTCYLSDDGLSGFAITKNGDLISVFNLNYKKKGFLRAIAPFIKENAKTLDCYVLNNDHNLKWLYETMFGFKTASIMDYNMEYDHDDIAKNHNNPKVAFMVNTTKKVETKEFDKDSYDEAQAYQQSFISEDIRYSKELGLDEEVKTEEEKPKRKMKPRDEFSIVRLIKDTANLNFDEYINLEDSREFIKNIRDYVDEQLQGKESNYKLFVNKNASIENLFRNFNLYHTNEKEYDKRLEQFVDNLLNSNIKEVKYNDEGKIISSKQYIKLSEFLELTFDENYTLQDYKNETVEEIKLFLLAKSKATKSKRLREYFNNRIDRLTNKIIYYKNVNTYTLDTIQEVQKLNEKVGKVKIQNVIKSDGKVQAVTSMFHNAIKDIHVTKSGKGISPTSITHILKSFEGYNEELFNNHEGEFLISYNKDLFDLLDFFRKKTNSEGKFPQRELKLDELIAVNNLVGIIKKTVNDLISDQALLQRQQNAQAKEEMLIAKGTDLYKGKDKLNFIEKEVAYATSFDISFGKWFGFNGDLYNIFIQDILDDYNRKLLKAHEYLQLVENAKKKYNLKDKELNAKVTITDKNGIEHTMTYQNLIEIYVISRTDNGLLTLLDGGYTFKLDKGNKPHTIKFNDSTLNQVNELLSDNMKAFGLDVLGFYNTELREYKAKADKKVFGTVLLQENVYYPLNKSDISSNKLTDDELNLTHLDPTEESNLQESKNMTWKAIDGVGIERRYRAYVDAITNYGETYESRLRLQNFTKSYTDGKSNLQIMKETIPFFGEMYSFYQKLIKGESVSKGNLDDSKLFENIVSATLYGNASVVLKQTASIPTILNEVSLNSWVKGISHGLSKLKDYNGHVADLIENSGFLAKRWNTNEPIKAQTLSKEVGKLGKIFGFPMEKMDQAVIVLFAYTSAEYEAEARGFKRGTKEFEEEVINILNRIVLNTQSNAVPLKMSPNRAGATKDWRKVLSVFSSDLQNKINYIIKYTEGYKNTVKRIKYIENRIKEIDEEIAKLEEEDKNNASLPSANGGNDDTSDNKAKIEELQELKKRLQKALEGEKQFIAKVPDQIKKLLVSLFLSALMIAGIEQLVSRLLGRKEWKWNEKDTSEFVNTLLIESTIGNIPYINQFINAMEYDQDLGGFQFTAFNEALDSIKKIIQMAETGNYNFATLAYELATTLGYFTGIPVKNLYNIAMGIIKNVSPSGYKLDNYIKGYSEAYVYTAYKEALQDRNYRIAKGNLELLLDVYKGGSVSDETLKEMFALAKEGYNVTPTTNLSQYEDENGNVIKLTNAQQKEFLSYYNQATTSVNEMIDITDYKSLDSENKAKAIKKLYSAYYYYGKAKVTGEIPDNKLAQLLYYSNGQIDVAKYIASLQKIGNIQATEKNSRKELVLQELNKMRLSKNEKLLVLYLSGYKLSEENKIQLESYLKTKGINEKSLAL